MNLEKIKINRVILKVANLLKRFTTATVIILLLQQDRDRHKLKSGRKAFQVTVDKRGPVWEWM